MKIGMTSLTFRNESVETVLKYASQAGISGIEWGVSDGHMILCDGERAKEIKALSEKYNIEIFSLGSYCKMENREDCDKTLETAFLLGAPVIRVWAGTKPPCKCDKEYIRMIADNTIYMAKKAQKLNIRIGFEYHQNTLTETSESAAKLIELVGMKNVGLYWQPLHSSNLEDNLKARKAAIPLLVGNLHIHNYSIEKGYQPLSEIKEILHMYYDDIKNEPYNLLIEFVKDSDLNIFVEDVNTLKEVVF